jgi:hypothetical protein
MNELKKLKEIYEDMYTEGKDERYDIDLIINGKVLAVQQMTNKENFDLTVKGSIKSFGKENVEYKFGKGGYVKVTTKD